MSPKLIRYAILNILLFTIIGCATYPPPIILPDKVTNFKYQYSVDVPEGWKVYGEVPNDFKDQMPSSAIKYVSLVMANKSTKSAIILANEKLSRSFQSIIDTPNKKFQEISDSMKTELEKHGNVTNYKCQLNTNNLSYTYYNYRQNNAAFKPEAWLETEADISFTITDITIAYAWFLYPCHKSNSCQSLVILISGIDNIEINRPAFSEVLKSIEMHDVPTD